jgi:hypothetical protein
MSPKTYLPDLVYMKGLKVVSSCKILQHDFKASGGWTVRFVQQNSPPPQNDMSSGTEELAA